MVATNVAVMVPLHYKQFVLTSTQTQMISTISQINSFILCMQPEYEENFIKDNLNMSEVFCYNSSKGHFGVGKVIPYQPVNQISLSTFGQSMVSIYRSQFGHLSREQHIKTQHQKK